MADKFIVPQTPAVSMKAALDRLKKQQEEMKVTEAQIAADKAAQDAIEASASEVNKFLVASLEDGFKEGQINKRIMQAVLDRSNDPAYDTLLFANKAMTDNLYGVVKDGGTYYFNDTAYTSIKDLEMAVKEFLGVEKIPAFRELLRAVVAGKPIEFEGFFRRLLFPKKESYDTAKLTANDAVYIHGLESY